jgi:hypothetical protein
MPEVFASAKRNKLKSQLCGDLNKFAEHDKNMIMVSSQESKNGRKCEWCGEPCWTFVENVQINQ